MGGKAEASAESAANVVVQTCAAVVATTWRSRESSSSSSRPCACEQRSCSASLAQQPSIQFSWSPLNCAGGPPDTEECSRAVVGHAAYALQGSRRAWCLPHREAATLQMQHMRGNCIGLGLSASARNVQQTRVCANPITASGRTLSACEKAPLPLCSAGA